MLPAGGIAFCLGRMEGGNRRGWRSSAGGGNRRGWWGSALMQRCSAGQPPPPSRALFSPPLASPSRRERSAGPGVPRCREPERALRTAEHRSTALGGGSLRGLRRRLGPSFISAAEMEREHARNRVGIGMCPSRVRVAWQRAVRQGKGGSCEGLPWDGEQTRRGYRTRE